ncbi:LysR family transcriptional regulator [Acetobacter conturbans]|uniref:LysR family transcriptional regulator n=1 Tax=Acetobacter conturbans TaxID=1737472 RepID=A0ABX0K3B5_9PROT|nr:LysR family transcriptional regulator [Acetobacter conturbans]NHN87939.1 LysR family transcriptional regulator [Acetobacter conturbans]
MRLPDFEAWAIFAKVAEHGSFARAAEAIQLSTPTVSKAITRLEMQLGISLFSRTSRQLSLTETGREALTHARRMLADAEAAETEVRDSTSIPSGVVRIAAPMTFGTHHLSPMLPRLLRLYPGLELDINFSDSLVDLVAEGFDLGIRIASLADSTLRVRKLCSVRLLAVATPEWLERAGPISHPDDLAPHKGFVYTNANQPGCVKLSNSAGQTVLFSQNPLIRANNAEAFLPTLEASLGYGIFPEFMIWRGLESGSLVPLLPDWQLPSIGIYLVTPPGAGRPLRVTAALDYLVEAFSTAPWTQSNAGKND